MIAAARLFTWYRNVPELFGAREAPDVLLRRAN
jgi:hypothetical protein